MRLHFSPKDAEEETEEDEEEEQEEEEEEDVDDEEWAEVRISGDIYREVHLGKIWSLGKFSCLALLQICY